MIRAARISQFIFASIVTATTLLAPLTSVHADVVVGDVAPEFTAKDSTGKDGEKSHENKGVPKIGASESVSYTQLTLPTKSNKSISRRTPYH